MVKMSDEQWRRQPEHGETPPPPGLPYQSPWPPPPNWWTASPEQQQYASAYQTAPAPRKSHRKAVAVMAGTAALAIALGSSVVAFDGSNGSSDRVSAFSPSTSTQTPQ